MKYYKDIANLLFWVLGACLATSNKSNSTNTECLEDSDVYLQQKINLIPQTCLQILQFKESCNLIGHEHFGQQLMELAKESQESNFHFAFFLKKIKMTKFSENAKYAIFGPFLPKFCQKGIFHKNRGPSLFTIYSPLTSCKKSEN